ncbi:PHD finger protein 7-like [Drosophila subpulchrella]|uniref:PHD finger protein 7-like n=1 Tax=Drosophila subpulchrella TaxID=1486046 RepID=UPI0018A18C54|nr:PHD finger protein 7-like [Drosophila subpulchrella]
MVHHNSLYLCSNLVQRGNSRVGIWRFLMDDIVAEARRCRHLICVYCQRPGANIGCCKSGCRRTFHTKCGIKNLAQNQFRGTYKSYCHRHVITHRRRPTSSDSICVICTELLVEEGERFNVMNMLYSPCCRNGWYHRRCLHVYANTSGYFLKCPLCNNNEEFHDVTLWGFALSSQDATWQTEPNAFAEHFRRDMVCVAEKCIALAGRTDNSILLLYCNTCGSSPAHALCIGQVVSPVPPSLVESENESVNSDDSDTFESIAQAASNHTPPRNQSPTTLTIERDNVQPKLYSSGWDLNDGNDTEDDEEVFQRAAEMQERQQTIAELSEDSSDEQPSTSAAAAQLLVIRRSTRSTAASGSSRAAPRRSSLRLWAQNNQERLLVLHHSGGRPPSLQRPIATREKHAPQDHGRPESDSLA